MLTKSHRFHGYNALNFVHQKGSTVRAAGCGLKYLLNNKRSDYRVAVVVSKKVSKSAVVRNRIRRRAYEAVRLQITGLDRPYDLVFMIYDIETATVPATTLQKTVRQLLQRAGVL